MMGLTRRRAGYGLIALSLAAGLASSAVGAAGSSGRKTSGTAWVGQDPKPSSSLIYDAGFIADRLLGRAAVTFTSKALAGPTTGSITVKSTTVTLWTPRGSLTGTGSAVLTLTNSPKPGDTTVSDGKLNLTRGTGALAGHSLHATFTGTGNTNLPNQYVFHYKGVYR